MSITWDVKQSELDKEFGNDIDMLLGASPYAWVVTYGFRSMAEQKALHDKFLDGGPLAAPAGRSAHNFGLAVDVAINVDGKIVSWSENGPEFPWLWAACAKHPRLRSGHTFPPQAPADDDHIQAVKWYALREQRKLQGTW